MSKLPTRFVITFLAIGILVGAATTATIVSAGLKPFNSALAQLRVPFLPQRPLVQAPLQQAAPSTTTGAPTVQQPLATTSQGSFGPNCAGCITTQNLANGAVTTPKIAPGAVSITTEVSARQVVIPPDSEGSALAPCPPGSVITGGGFDLRLGHRATGQVIHSAPNLGIQNGWNVVATNANPVPIRLTAFADCTSILP